MELHCHGQEYKNKTRSVLIKEDNKKHVDIKLQNPDLFRAFHLIFRKKCSVVNCQGTCIQLSPFQFRTRRAKHVGLCTESICSPGLISLI